MSPHNVLGQVSARLLIAVAQDDDAKAPADKTTFAEAALASSVGATVTVYPGNHGWMVSDSPAYDATASPKRALSYRTGKGLGCRSCPHLAPFLLPFCRPRRCGCGGT